MTPDAYCQQKAAPNGSSIYYALLFLPPAQRRALTALHAFNREVLAVADTCQDPGVAAAKLAWWQGEIERLFSGGPAANPTPPAHPPTHPIMQALMPHVQTGGIRAEHLHAMLQGGWMNLNQTRYLDWPALRTYCWHAAGVLGRCSARMDAGTGEMGDEKTDGENAADGEHTTGAAENPVEKLSLATCLTHLIRHVGQDAQRGRIYLPVNELQQFGVKAADILNPSPAQRPSPQFVSLMQFQAQRARQLWREAVQALQALPADVRRTQRPALALAVLAHALLDQIADRMSASRLASHLSLS